MQFNLEDPASVRAWVATRPGAHALQLAALLVLPLWGRWRDLRVTEGWAGEFANPGGEFAHPIAGVPCETRGKGNGT
jgi:hypothetical protein